MQANGSLRRPLWDILKSIGGGRTAHEPCRGLRIHRVSIDAGRGGVEQPAPAAAAAAAAASSAKGNQPWHGCGSAVRRIPAVGKGAGRPWKLHGGPREQSRRLQSSIAQGGQRRYGRGNDVRTVAGVGVGAGGLNRMRGEAREQAEGASSSALKSVGQAASAAERVAQDGQRWHFRRHAARESAEVLSGAVPMKRISTTRSANAQDGERWRARRHAARRGADSPRSMRRPDGQGSDRHSATHRAGTGGREKGSAGWKSKHAEQSSLAQDQDKASVQARTSTVRNVLVTRADTEDAKEGSNDVETAGAFEAVVQRAVASPVDHKPSRWPQFAPDGELRPRYFKAYQGTAENRLMKQVSRWQRQRERYGVENARNWRSALDLLDQATPDGQTRHKRRMETVKLEEGLQATWKIHPGEVVLEIMQRTGAHLQTLPLAGDAGTFNLVSLWGTPAQNEHAKRILPMYVEAADQQRKPLNAYSLKSEVTQGVDAALAIFGADAKDETDTEYWREQEIMDDSEMELLEDALGDITNAPTRGPAPIRAVWAPSQINIRSRPTQWNQLTFAAYVDALTSHVPRLAQRKLYGAQSPRSTQGHVENMTAELVRIFTARKPSTCASAGAVDTAVRFFMKYNDFAAARKVFLGLEGRQFDFTASNFNSFFEVAAREESVPNFIYTLRFMISKGLRPTARTWTAFHLLMARRFPLETNVVTELMRRKGLFGNMDTVRAIAAGNVDFAIAAHLSVGKSVADFMLSCEGSYGEPAVWLSVRFANKMARVLLERGRVEDATNVVRQFEAAARSRGRQGVRTETLNTFLASCMRDGNVEAALAYLRLFMSPPPSIEDPQGPKAPPIGRFTDDPLAVEPDHITYGILFGMAWHHRFFNVLRAIWRHACAFGKVSFKMQDAVRRSLSREVMWVEPSNDEADVRVDKKKAIWPISDRNLWSTLAGKFVVGLDADLPGTTPSVKGSSDILQPDGAAEGEETAEKDDLSFLTTSLESLAKPKPIEPTDEPGSTPFKLASIRSHPHRRQLARALLHTDLDEAGSVKPVNLLLQDLERAWRLDVLWKGESLGKRQRVKKSKGVMSDEGQSERSMTLRESILDMFNEMLERGVRVPMRMGDVAGVRDVEGLATVQYKP